MRTLNIKVGDKILCKKSEHRTELYLTKGIEYVIFEVNDFYFMGEYLHSTYTVIDDKYDDRDFIGDDEFNEYFYNNIELRNIKLKKLNEES